MKLGGEELLLHGVGGEKRCAGTAAASNCDCRLLAEPEEVLQSGGCADLILLGFFVVLSRVVLWCV
jgi:hypothetical protein